MSTTRTNYRSARHELLKASCELSAAIARGLSPNALLDLLNEVNRANGLVRTYAARLPDDARRSIDLGN